MLTNVNDIPSLKIDLNGDVTPKIKGILKNPLTITETNKIYPLIFSLIDYTTLEGADTISKVSKMCDRVLAFEVRDDIPNVAAICVYPTFAKLVSKKLQTTKVNTACVA